MNRQQIPVQKVSYDPTQTYISFVTSDGDNLAYDYGATRDLMAARVALCAAANATAKDCPPVSWTLSPRLPEIAPAWIEWYYSMARATMADSFLFGPSGFGYLYPAQLTSDDRRAFTALTIAAAENMDVSALVESENCCGGKHATSAYVAARMDEYRLYNGSKIRAVFTGNMPAQLVGTTALISEPVRGYDPYASVPLNASAAVASLDALPRGTTTQMVVIVNPAQAAQLVAVSRGVADHVHLVGHRELAELQRQKMGWRTRAATRGLAAMEGSL